jgi:hypothetical protein
MRALPPGCAARYQDLAKHWKEGSIHIYGTIDVIEQSAITGTIVLSPVHIAESA